MQQAWGHLDEQQRRIVIVGCSYDLDRSDQDDDLDSVFGFDDDARLLSQVLEVIGGSDLGISI